VSGQTASKARIMCLFCFVSFYSLFFKDVHNFATLNVRSAARPQTSKGRHLKQNS
jgi:hypothetical protein